MLDKKRRKSSLRHNRELRVVAAHVALPVRVLRDVRRCKVRDEMQ